jgi:hypothetical protein
LLRPEKRERMIYYNKEGFHFSPSNPAMQDCKVRQTGLVSVR